MRYGRGQDQLNNIAHQHKADWRVAAGGQTEFFLDHTVLASDNLLVFTAGLLRRPADKDGANFYRIRGIHANTPSSSPAYPGDSNAVTFAAAPGAGVLVCFITMGG